MDRIVEVLLINAASASVLALLVSVAARFIRRPAVTHVLWLIVLVKLLTPPVIEVGLLPDWSPPPGPTVQATTLASEPSRTSGTLAEPGPGISTVPTSRGRAGAVDLGIAVWFAGCVGLLALAGFRSFRFERIVARSRGVSGRIARAATRLACRLGIPRCPRIRLVPGRVPPMLRPHWGSAELLIPSALLGVLDENERDALITHELAHYRRRDHWVRYVELAAFALFWWHPVVWWTRRNLRSAEEKSCDAIVLRALPGRSRAYADGLLKTLDFLAGDCPAAPALATGAGHARQLKERLTMIMSGKPPKKTSWILRGALTALALAVLATFPTWVQPGSSSGEPQGDPGDTPGSASVTGYEAELQRMRLRQAELEREMRELHAREMELRVSMEQNEPSVRSLELERRAAELERRGRHEEARAVAASAEKIRRMKQLEQERMDAEIGFARASGDLQLELERTRAKLDRALADRDAARALELEDRAHEIELRLGELSLENRRRAIDVERALLEKQFDEQRLRHRDAERRIESEHVERRVRDAGLGLRELEQRKVELEQMRLALEVTGAAGTEVEKNREEVERINREIDRTIDAIRETQEEIDRMNEELRRARGEEVY